MLEIEMLSFLQAERFDKAVNLFLIKVFKRASYFMNKGEQIW